MLCQLYGYIVSIGFGISFVEKWNNFLRTNLMILDPNVFILSITNRIPLGNFLEEFPDPQNQLYDWFK